MPQPPLFTFALNSAPVNIIVNQGGNLNYSEILVVPQPNKFQGAAPGQASVSELIAFNVTSPSGLTLHFFGSNLTSGIFKEVSANGLENLPVELIVSQNMAPGDYAINVTAASGTYVTSYSLGVKVVQYLVIANLFLFSPKTLTVKAGSTVYWLDLDDRPEGVYNMVFDSMNLRSPQIHGAPTVESWSHVFGTPGTYTYHCECMVQGVGGTIIVTS